MKLERAKLHRSMHTIPALRWEDQELTSFAGLVLFQKLIQSLDLKGRLRACVRHLPSASCYRPWKILLLLMVHLVLGWRRLRDLELYQSDPLVPRVLGLTRLPCASTLSRELRRMDERVVENLGEVCARLVLDRVVGMRRVTLDFDGSVQSTKSRRTQGSAVGFNPKSKGERSYYPLLATVAQTGQVLAVHHRPGNVHDSHGAKDFIERCVGRVRATGFQGLLEARLDSAHFGDELCFWLHEQGVEFTISVPWARFPALKDHIDHRRRWTSVGGDWSFFEAKWFPHKWASQGPGRFFRLFVFRHAVRDPRKGPIQGNLFEPCSRHYEYTAVITNQHASARAVLHFHHGRGSQEHLFGELKSGLQLDYLATRREIGNRIYTLCGILAINVLRELQMRASPRKTANTWKRAGLWMFETFRTFRKHFIQRAGRLTQPHGQLTLIVSAGHRAAAEFRHLLMAA